MDNKTNIYELISYNIKKIRVSKKITQKQLAIKTNYTHEFIRRIEAPNSKKSFSLDTISNIADALDVDIKELFNQKDNRN